MEHTIKNVWDFLIVYKDIIGIILATISGALFSHILNNLGGLRMDCQECDIGNNGIGCKVIIDIYNSSNNYKVIKDINLKLVAGECDICFELNNLGFNGERCKTVNILKIPPKEVVRVFIDGCFEKEKLDCKHKSLSSYFTYKTQKDKTRKRLLKKVNLKNGDIIKCS